MENLGVIWTPKPSKITLLDTKKYLEGISKNVNIKHRIEYILFYLNIIPMSLYMDIMLYFIK